jgi:Na+/H+-dicarboxylate symporter
MADSENKSAAMDDVHPQQSPSAAWFGPPAEEEVKRTWYQSLVASVKEPGSATQIIIAAILAIAIGMPVVSTVEEVPQAAIDIISIPGGLWLRALKCIVLPLIVTAMIIAIQRLKELAGDSRKLATWTIGYYVLTTILAIAISITLTALVWAPRFTQADEESLEVTESDQETIDETPVYTISESVVNLFNSFISDNFVGSLAEAELLAVLVAAVVIGSLLKPGASLMKAVYEIEEIVMKVVTFLIQAAPYGVFSLILSNLFKLDLETMGQNLGFLIAGALVNMFIHIWVVLPILFFALTRMNPYTYWLKCSAAWITAWGSASSAGTLPVTLKVVTERGVPTVISKFATPLGCLINMDGTAIYFPVAVTFLARTQGIDITPVQYIIVLCLSTLASIGTTPIPSASLVLIVMIAQSINVPLTGMFAVIVAIDWFLDRFRTALNVTGDCFAVKIIEIQTGIKDDVEEQHITPNIRV